MTVRTPLKLDGSNNLIEMSTTDINNIKSQVRYLYGTDPSVDLSRVASSGTLGSISDTRKQAGTSTTDVTDYDTELETPDVTTVTVEYANVSEATENTTETADTNNVVFPVYNNSGNIQSMTLADMYDTFIYPAIDTLTDGSDQPGTYRVHSANTLSGHTLISTSVIFADTRANPDSYTGDAIPEALDQPTTVTNYYLFRTNSGNAVSYSNPVFIRNADKNLQQYTTANFDAILKNCVRHVASEVVGSRIRYRFNGAGNARGTGMSNTILVNSTYNQRLVTTDDYRTQEFPSGTEISTNTHYLRIYQV
tara:strand:+ start:6367 stop:7290 length:924 start_codon:yes stop_codon:yes gene_type:complete